MEEIKKEKPEMVSIEELDTINTESKYNFRVRPNVEVGGAILSRAVEELQRLRLRDREELERLYGKKKNEKINMSDNPRKENLGDKEIVT